MSNARKNRQSRATKRNEKTNTAQANQREAQTTADAAPDPRPKVEWIEEHGYLENCAALGQAMQASRVELFRSDRDYGLLEIRPNDITRIDSATAFRQALPRVVRLSVFRDGKRRGHCPAAQTLDTILATPDFRDAFPRLDTYWCAPGLGPDFRLPQPGYNRYPSGESIYYAGPQIEIGRGLDSINRFLDCFDFATRGDRANALAAFFTVLLRRHFPGRKPLIFYHANRPHVGKGLLTNAMFGTVRREAIIYEAVDWPMEVKIIAALRTYLDLGGVLLDNVRVDAAGGRSPFVRSQLLESAVTAEVLQFRSPAQGGAWFHGPNYYVWSLNANDAQLSPDLLVRSLPIRLEMHGSLAERRNPIDHLEAYIEEHRLLFYSEMLGALERWHEEGRPLNTSAYHPMRSWAQVTGGILQVLGVEGFLENYQERRVKDDPVLPYLAILGAAHPGVPLTPHEWATHVVRLGLAKHLIPAAEQHSDAGRARGIGCVLAARRGEQLTAQDDTYEYTLRLEGGRQRWESEAPHRRYVFRVLARRELPTDGD